jgi:copper chaperone CopZ
VSVVLGKIPGVASVTVSLERAEADLRFAPGNAVTPAQVEAAIHRAGYGTRGVVLTILGKITERDGEPVLESSGDMSVYTLRHLPEAHPMTGAFVRVTGPFARPDAGQPAAIEVRTCEVGPLPALPK